MTEELVDEIVQLAPQAPREKVEKLLAQQYSGPIPPPSLFKAYGDVVADAPERILRVFEADSKHVREMQANALQAQRDESQRVHWMAFALIGGGLLLSLVFAHLNKDWLAGGLLTTTLVGSISALLQSRSSAKEGNNPEHEETDAIAPIKRGGNRKASTGQTASTRRNR